ncbi:hypothetical protein THAOC_02337 [Thalassiosira oceanica]|uniref:Uncharacterized protein n=1 Tax=Thalassiosira oceanica TaxID=159749 RepID=K0TAX8_THAOC|nr:hypothetical protein THAOC_02337 [Thalassiosira oceanica]|eukprot:EJK75923.1 hypothetical protein THAOC_02337 [Thalassiosira oceanica]
MVSRQDLRSASAANASGGGGTQPGTPRASGAAAGAGATPPPAAAGTPIQGSLRQTSALKSLLKNSAGLKLVERRLISSHYTEAFELPELTVDDAAVLSCRNKDQLLRCFDLGSTKNIFEDNVSESHAKAVSSLIVLTGSKQHLYLDKWSYNYVLNCCSSELKSELEKIMDKLPKQHRALPTLLYNLKNLTMMADPKVVKAMEDQLEQLLKNEGITVVGGEDVPNFTEAVELLGSSVSGLGGNIRDYPEAFLEGLSLTTSNSTFRATMKQASVEATSNSWQLISAKLGKNVADMGPLDKLKAISTYAKELYWPLSFRGEWKPEGSRGRGKKKTGVANRYILARLSQAWRRQAQGRRERLPPQPML